MAISGGDGSIVLATKVDETGLKKGLVSLKKLGATAGKTFLAIGAAAATATVAITKMAVSAYADYEQLVGGVETLFKDSAGKVLEYANQAFQIAGVSANEYMQQVTSFSASLLSSLAGDTDKAADVANMALIDISDNVNKMGSSMESVTLAYQGFAKQQYMLLDNLKLGYGGTKTEMERLLKDAQALTGVKYDINNLADVYSAVHAIQEQLGITGTTMKEAETTITGSVGMVKASWQNLLTAMSGGGDLDRAINNFVYSFEKMSANLVPVIERTLLGLGQALQKTLPMLVQTVVTALVQQIPNLVMAVYNMIVGLFKGIILGIKALFTGGTAKATEVIKGNVSGISSSASSAAENMNDVADATKKAGKEAKKSLAAFDELNILSSGASGGAGETPEASMPTISAGSGGGGLLGDLDGATQEIDAQLTAIMGIAGEALIAIGLLLLFFGQVAWGIGFIIAGAVTFAVAVSNSAKGDVATEVIGMLTTIMGIAGGALLALGIILLWLGGVVGKGVAIGMIIAGAALIVGAVATKAAFSPDDIKGWLSTILGIAAGALLALGIILCMVGSTPIGVSMIIVGSVALVSAVALNYNEVTDKITGWVAVIMAIAGGALLVLGIVLCCTGAGIALGIALIVVGAVALVTPIALNWNYITEKVTQFFQDNAGLIVGVSIALIVLGVILLFTGVGIPLAIGLIVAGGGALAAEIVLNWNFIKEKTVEIFNNIMDWVKTWGLLILGIILVVSGVGIPLGIALMLKGGANLTEAQDPLWTAIVDRVKTAWEAIKAFWNTHIAKWFTKEHWAGLAKNMMNGLIEKIEAGLNNILTKFHNANLGKAIDFIAGGLGFDIPKSIHLPRLARGAVIPPNREFLAVLGDQKHGTNIEAPLQTIVDAFNIALQGNANYGGGNTEVVLELDGREFGRAVVEQGNRETRRIGTRLVNA